MTSPRPTTPPLTLYMFEASNSSQSVRLLLDHVGLDYRRVDLLPGLHAAVILGMGFGGRTVPALRIGRSRKVLGSRAIASIVARELAPGAGLLPVDDADRAEVIRLEAEGERMQKALRRLMYVGAADDPVVVQALVDSTGFRRLPAPGRRLVTKVLVPAAGRGHAAKAERAPSYIDTVCEVLDQVDAAVEAGVLGSATPNVADFQLAPNISALALAPGIADAVRARPAWRIAAALLPVYPIDAQLQMPTEWIERFEQRGVAPA